MTPTHKSDRLHGALTHGSQSLDPRPHGGEGATIEISAPLASLMRMFSALSGSSLQQTFVTNPALPSDPNALPLLVDMAMRGQLRPAEIADRLHVSAPTASRLIAKLESTEFISRTQDPHDARAFLVDLTPKGTALINEVFTQGNRLMAGVLSAWSQQEQAQLITMLARLTDDLSQQLAQPPHSQ